MVFIKQFGLQRSGTNVTKALIEVNFKNTFVLSNVLGNKHEGTTWGRMAESIESPELIDSGLRRSDLAEIKSLIEEKELNIVINLKDPISWLESYYRYSKKKVLFKNPEADFPLNIKFCKRHLENWELHVLSWLKLAESSKRCVVVRHEEVLLQPKAVLERLQKTFDLTPAVDVPVLQFEGVAKRGTDQDHGKDLIFDGKKFDASYHTEKKWKDNFPDKELNFALEHCAIIGKKEPALADFIELNFS